MAKIIPNGLKMVSKWSQRVPKHPSPGPCAMPHRAAVDRQPARRSFFGIHIRADSSLMECFLQRCKTFHGFWSLLPKNSKKKYQTQTASWKIPCCFFSQVFCKFLLANSFLSSSHDFWRRSKKTNINSCEGTTLARLKYLTQIKTELDLAHQAGVH